MRPFPVTPVLARSFQSRSKWGNSSGIGIEISTKPANLPSSIHGIWWTLVQSLTATCLHPLSFAEFAAYRGLAADKRIGYGHGPGRYRAPKLLDEYLTWGGLFEVQDAPNEDQRRRIVSTYLDLVVYGDLVERHSVKNLGAMKALIRYFVTKRGPRIVAAYQVSVDPDSAGERETKGLLAALDSSSLESGTIVTADIDREDTIGGKQVRYIPLWRWLLESPDAGQGVGIPETRRGAS